MTIASQVGQRTTMPGASAYTSDSRPAAALPSSRRDSGITARSFHIPESFDPDGGRWMACLDEAVRHCLDERGGAADEDVRPLVDGPDVLADGLRCEPAA